MSLIHGVGDFFALDIGTSAIRLLQLSGDIKHGWDLRHFAYVPVDEKVLRDSSTAGKRKVGEYILSAVQQAGIVTKNVAVGLPADKTYTAIIDVPNMAPNELEKTVKYQLDKYIPMPIDEAKTDYVILGTSPIDATKAEVLISSAANKYVEGQLEMVEALGLNVIAQEPEPLAMARALMPIDTQHAQLILDLGERAADLVIVYHGMPTLVRSIPGGLQMMAKTVAATLSVREDQSRQFILKFGLAQDKVRGQVFKALSSVLDGFTAEITKSIRFFQSKYTNIPVNGIVLSGFAGIIPFMAEYTEAKTGVRAVQGNPWQMVRVSPQQQGLLQPVASEFAVAIGLAERSND